MKVPFLDLKSQYQGIKSEVEPEVLKVFESCAYIGGPYVQKFEQEAAEYLHVKHAMRVLHLMKKEYFVYNVKKVIIIQQLALIV